MLRHCRLILLNIIIVISHSYSMHHYNKNKFDYYSNSQNNSMKTNKYNQCIPKNENLKFT